MLRIKGWHKNFETERTATFNRRQQIDIPTDITDMNLIWLLTGHKNGAAHFAVWILLCENHANTTKPRGGWLSHNGKKDGIPLTAKDLNMQIHISENIIIEALERLSSPKIGWIEEIPVERSVRAAQEQSISSGQAASLIPSYPIPPNPTPSNKEVATTVPTIFTDLSYEYLKQQLENFPNESALKSNFDYCVEDGAKKLHLFHKQNGWDIEIIANLLDWILNENDFWLSQLRTLGGIRIRKQGKGTPMKFENARAAMEQSPKEGDLLNAIEESLEGKTYDD